MINLPAPPDFMRARRIGLNGPSNEHQVAVNILVDSIVALLDDELALSDSIRFWGAGDMNIGRVHLRKETATWWNAKISTKVRESIVKQSSQVENNRTQVNRSHLQSAIQVESHETTRALECAQFLCEKWLVDLGGRFKRQINTPEHCPKANEETASSWPELVLAEWRLNCFKWFRDQAVNELTLEANSSTHINSRGSRHLVLERLKNDGFDEAAALESIQLRMQALERREASERKEEQRREAARIKLEQVRRVKIQSLRQKYGEDLAREYINTACSINYRDGDVELSQEDRHSIEEAFVKRWFNSPKNIAQKAPPTTEQIKVISQFQDRMLVRARAGSGKTKTLVSRAVFLVRHCGVDPSEILLLAFNKNAALKLERDLIIAFGLQKLPPDQAVNRLPVVQTFDAFAKVISGLSVLEQNELDQLVQSAIEDNLQRDEEGVKNAMLHFFRAEWERVALGILPGRDTVLEQRRSEGTHLTLAGDQVKSRGEHRIANWLFEHDIPYAYEKPFRKGKAPWLPDFTLLPDINLPILVEYLGLQGDPDYDKKSEWKKEQIDDLDEGKRPTVVWLEPSSTSAAHGNPARFEVLLTAALGQHQVTPTRLTDDQIWQKIKLSAISEFRKVTKQVIERAIQARWSPQELARRALETPVPQLLGLCAEVMQHAKSQNANQKRPYATICWAAADKLQAGEVTDSRLLSQSGHPRLVDIRKLREVIVDEYQDCSLRFNAIVAGTLNTAPLARLLAVGDDWQAINRYAGSDPEFITSWTGHELTLTANHRSRAVIVNLGNSVMPNRGPIAHACDCESCDSDAEGTALRLDIGLLRLSVIERERLSRISPIKPEVFAGICRLAIPHLRAQQSVAVLAQTNNELHPTKSQRTRPTESPLRELILELSGSSSGNLEVGTVHSAKGQEANTVILLTDSFPLLHPHRVITEVFGDTEPALIEDQRRLLYVGITASSNS